jgi:hypothetical protein
MQEYLFRIEGVNLDSTVYDTSDISTIRGGGFYLLSRVKALAEKFVSQDNLITEGASSAVIRVETDEPENIRKDMLRYLYSPDEQPAIHEMMFLVEYLENVGNFSEIMARLLGKVRFSQMQSPSVRIFPETLAAGSAEDGETMHFDSFNRVLPAHHRKEKGNASGFTHKRQDQGRRLRKRIYENLLADQMRSVSEYKFTEDLQALSKDSLKGNLDGKIAYLSIDGNKFGSLQRNLTADQLRDFDRKIQLFKKLFLSSVLGLAQEYKSFLTSDHRLRMETLLWGGDELKLVVPAWMGWKVADLFFELATASDMCIETQVDGKRVPCHLTYALGLVFAHHKNPILNIDRIAADLVNTVKRGLKGSIGDLSPAYDRARGNRMHYVVLESLETLPAGYEKFAREHYGLAHYLTELSPEDAKALEKFAKLLSPHFPRSSLHKIARSAIESTAGYYYETLQRALDVCQIPDGEKTELTRNIEVVTGTTIVDGKVNAGSVQSIFRWRQVAELWDYLTWKEN